MQSAPEVLGERHQEPPVRVRHPQEQHHGRLPFGGGPDLHGLLLHLRAPAGQGLALQQAALRQGHPQLQELGGEVRRPLTLQDQIQVQDDDDVSLALSTVIGQEKDRSRL